MAPAEPDLTSLSPEDLRRVRAWVEDRFVNAVTPLHLRLQREPRGNFLCDATLCEAQRAVAHVMEHVEEIRALAAGRG